MRKAGGKKAAGAPDPAHHVGSARALREQLQLGRLLAEKCELKAAEETFRAGLKLAQRSGDSRMMIEALSWLLRLAAEALDEEGIRRWNTELDRLIKAAPSRVPPLAWYCRGVVAKYQGDFKLAQRQVHRYLRAVRSGPQGSRSVFDSSQQEAEAKGWALLAVLLFDRGHLRRAGWLAEEILKRYESRHLRGIIGTVHVLLGKLAERRRDLDEALRRYQQAHACFLAEHNWFSHLYVLHGYARLARLQQNYSQAYWYLDLIDKAAPGAEFSALRREVAAEKARLEQDAVDLLIDSRRGLVRTREGGQISLRKQYVLLSILEALSGAHAGEGERGLSKAEIIEKVWNEQYRPEAHDNKLYYNINRLRKLIEPDMREPQYLLNWKEGYRLAPGLRIHRIGAAGRKSETGEGNKA